MFHTLRPVGSLGTEDLSRVHWSDELRGLRGDLDPVDVRELKGREDAEWDDLRASLIEYPDPYPTHDFDEDGFFIQEPSAEELASGVLMDQPSFEAVDRVHTMGSWYHPLIGDPEWEADHAAAFPYCTHGFHVDTICLRCDPQEAAAEMDECELLEAGAFDGREVELYCDGEPLHDSSSSLAVAFMYGVGQPTPREMESLLRMRHLRQRFSRSGRTVGTDYYSLRMTRRDHGCSMERYGRMLKRARNMERRRKRGEPGLATARRRYDLY